jgi:hypothetical protein
MLLVHTFIECIYCGKHIEIDDEEIDDGEIKCFMCDGINKLADPRVTVWEELY